MSNNSNENNSNENIKEEKIKKFARIKESISIYIAKMIAFLGLACIDIFTAQSENALLLVALTYAVGIIFDMIILSKNNKNIDVITMNAIQWFYTIILGCLTIAVFVLLVSYDSLIQKHNIAEVLNSQINLWVPVYMCGIGVMSTFFEAYYSMPYDN